MKTKKETHFSTVEDCREALKDGKTEYGFAVADTLPDSERKQTEGSARVIHWEQLTSLLRLIKTPGVIFQYGDSIWIKSTWVRRVMTGSPPDSDIYDLDLTVGYHKEGESDNHRAAIKGDGQITYEY